MIWVLLVCISRTGCELETAQRSGWSYEAAIHARWTHPGPWDEPADILTSVTHANQRECLRALRRAMPEDEYYDDTNQYHNIVHEPEYVSYTQAYQTHPMMVSNAYYGCFHLRSPSS